MSTNIKWTEEEIERLRHFYPEDLEKLKAYLKAVRTRSLVVATDVRRIKTGFVITEGNVITHRSYG